MANAERDRIILRAELRSADETVIAYAFDLSATSVFVVTDLHVTVGSAVSLRLSFPRLVEPVDLEARVDELRVGSGLGDANGIVLRLDTSTEGARARIAALLERLDVSTPTVNRSGREPYRILLVEDSGFIRDVFDYGLRKIFDRPGSYRVDHADCAERAWDKLVESEYDLMIVDYYLPASDGASLISRIRQDARLVQLPVVAMSVGGRDAREATIAAGADVFLDKPVAFRDLFNTVRLHAQHDEARPAQRKKAILVLDDSPLVLAVTSAALKGAGFEVAVAADLSTFEQQRGALDPDLILVDVQMPEAFGDDVASTLRAQGVQIPILLVSSIAESELARRAKHAQAGYIMKAAGMPELVRRCKEVLGAAS